MPRTCPLLALVVTLFISVAGCGSDDSGKRPAVDSTSQVDQSAIVTCDSIAFSSNEAEPMDSVRVSGVTRAMGDSLYATVWSPTDSLAGLALVRRSTSNEAVLRVPIHPSLTREGGDVEVTITNGTIDCAPEPFTIADLKKAPGTTQAVLDTARALARQKAEIFGVDTTDLLEARIDDLPTPVVPTAVAFRAIGQKNDSGSLIGRMNGGALNVDLADALLAKAGAAEVLSEQLRVVRSIELPVPDPDSMTQSSSAMSPPSRHRHAQFASLGPSPSPQGPSVPANRTPRRTKSASPSAPPAPAVTGQCPDASPPPRPPQYVSCADAAIVITPDIYVGTAQRLSDYMNVALAAKISLDPDVVQYLDLAIETVELGSAGFAFAGALLPGPGKKLSGGLASAYGGTAGVLEAVKLIRTAESKTLPRHLTGINVRMSPTTYNEDDDRTGRIQDVRLRAASEGWKLDRTLMNMLVSQLDIPWAKGPTQFLQKHGAADVTQEVSSNVIDTIVSEIFGKAMDVPVTDGDESTARAVCIPSESYTVSIREKEWSDIKLIEGDAIRFSDRFAYDPVDVGTARLMVSSKASSDGQVRFGAQQAKTCPTVDVQPIDVVVTPPSKNVRAGEEVSIRATVQNADDTGLAWSIETGGGRLLDVVGDPSSNPHQVLVRIPDPMEGPVIAKATSTADRSHLRTSGEERAGTSRLHGDPVPLAGACSIETMKSVVNTNHSGTMTTNPAATDPRGMQSTNPVRVRTGGLMMDSGVACSFPIGALSADGAKNIGLLSSDEARAMEGKKLDQGLDAAKRLDSLAEAGKIGGAEMGQALADLNASQQPASGSPKHVIFQVFSPSILTTQALGYLDNPRTVAHGGTAGWRRNAAMLVNIHLPGTKPEDLEEGKTYAARAYSPSEGVPDVSGVVPTRSGFYTRWSGQTVDAPGCLSAEGKRERERELAICRQLVEGADQIEGQLDDVGRAAENAMREGQAQLTPEQKQLAESFIPKMSDRFDRGYRDAIDCKQEVGMTAFSGETEVITGSMTGRVTIQEITDSAVIGTFELGGTGRRLQETYTLRTCRDGTTISGNRIKTETQTGPISMSGELHAPNRTSGLFRAGFVTTTVSTP